MKVGGGWCSLCLLWVESTRMRVGVTGVITRTTSSQPPPFWEEILVCSVSSSETGKVSSHALTTPSSVTNWR